MGGFGCAAPAPEVTPTPTPIPAKPTPAKPTPTPAPSPAAPEVIKWNGQTSYFSAPPPIEGMPSKAGMGIYGEDWANWIKDVTNGRLELEIAPPESVVSSAEALIACGEGSIDFWATACSGCYATGIIPEAYFATGMPWGWLATSDAWDFLYNRGGIEIMEEAYAEQNLKYFPWPCYDTYAIHSTVPIYRVADLEGVKIRIAGGNAKLVKAFGASPTVFPPAEAYMALKLGTLEAAHWGVSVLDTVKTKEVIKYLVTKPVAFGGLLDAVVNLDKWNALPEDIRELVGENTKYRILATATVQEAYAKYIVSAAVRDYGIELITWPDEDYKLLMAEAVKVVEEIGAMSPRNKRGADMLIQQAKDMGRL